MDARVWDAKNKAQRYVTSLVKECEQIAAVFDEPFSTKVQKPDQPRPLTVTLPRLGAESNVAPYSTLDAYHTMTQEMYRSEASEARPIGRDNNISVADQRASSGRGRELQRKWEEAYQYSPFTDDAQASPPFSANSLASPPMCKQTPMGAEFSLDPARTFKPKVDADFNYDRTSTFTFGSFEEKHLFEMPWEEMPNGLVESWRAESLGTPKRPPATGAAATATLPSISLLEDASFTWAVKHPPGYAPKATSDHAATVTITRPVPEQLDEDHLAVATLRQPVETTSRRTPKSESPTSGFPLAHSLPAKTRGEAGSSRRSKRSQREHEGEHKKSNNSIPTGKASRKFNRSEAVTTEKTAMEKPRSKTEKDSRSKNAMEKGSLTITTDLPLVKKAERPTARKWKSGPANAMYESSFEKWCRKGECGTTPKVLDSQRTKRWVQDEHLRMTSHFKNDLKAVFHNGDDDDDSSLPTARDAKQGQHALKMWQLRKRAEYLKIPINDVVYLKQLFDTLDVDGSGTLDFDEFETVVQKLMERTKAPADNVRAMCEWGHWDADKNGGIDFDDFLKWYSSNSFKEDLLLSADQREMRKIGRRYGVAPDYVEQARKIFDECTKNDEATIDEFAPVLYKILKVPPSCEIPESRIRFFWAEIDADCSGKIGFSEFFAWWMRYFSDKGGISQQPYEKFYSQVRRIGKGLILDPRIPYDKATEADTQKDLGRADDDEAEPLYVRLSELLLAQRAKQKEAQRKEVDVADTTYDLEDESDLEN